MYADDYGTDWDALDIDEAIERAFALGVEDAVGERRPDELDRVLAEADSAYERTLIELSYDEGRTLGREYEPAERESAWDELVTGQELGEWTEVDEEELEDVVPGAVSRIGALDPPRRRNRAIELPRFLLRRR